MSSQTSGNDVILTDLEGLAVGEKLTLRELQGLVDKGENPAELTVEEKGVLIKNLEEDRQLKDTGMRISNRAAAQDVHNVMENIYSEVSRTLIPAESVTDVFPTESSTILQIELASTP